MKLGTILLLTALAISSECAFAQTSTSLPGTNAGSPASGSANTGSFMNGITTTGVGGISTLAGSIAAGANSTLNPSGNSFINTSPSGSTIEGAGGQFR
jgi:hypothetical protein